MQPVVVCEPAFTVVEIRPAVAVVVPLLAGELALLEEVDFFEGPVRIDIPRMLLALRARAEEGGYTPRWVGYGLRVFRLVATRPWLFRLASSAGRRLSGWFGPRGFDRLPGPLAGWTKYRHFPAMAPETFTARRRRRGRS